MTPTPTTSSASAGYGRVSTDKQDHSIEWQRAELCRYCELKGLPPPALFMDSDTSGSIPFADRDSAGQLLTDCLAGKYRHIVVSKIDRLGRDAMDVQTVIQLLGKAEVTVHIIDLGGSSFDTRSPINGMIIALLAWAAQMMRDTIRTNVNAGLGHKRSKNELTGTVPFGWDAVATGEVRRNKGGKDIKIRRLVDNLEEQKMDFTDVALAAWWPVRHGSGLELSPHRRRTQPQPCADQAQRRDVETARLNHRTPYNRPLAGWQRRQDFKSPQPHGSNLATNST